jgi:hypothetical protein
MEYIGSFVNNNSTLKMLNLEGCGIDGDGIIHLSKALPQSYLEMLTLTFNSLDDRSCANILSSIPPTLTKLSFAYNEITESSLETFLTFLHTNRTLKQLNISFNPIFDNFYSDDNICANKLRNSEEQNNICKFTDVY